MRQACLAWNRTAQGAVEPELPLVIIADGPQIFPAALVQRLERLEHFKRQTLTAPDAFQVPAVRFAGDIDSRLGYVNLETERFRLGVRFDDLAGHLIHEPDLGESGLLQP